MRKERKCFAKQFRPLFVSGATSLRTNSSVTEIERIQKGVLFAREAIPRVKTAFFPREGLRGGRRGTTFRWPAQQHGRRAGIRPSRGVTCPAPHLPPQPHLCRKDGLPYLAHIRSFLKFEAFRML
ncbi:hypothetical protein AVEN_15414-1 [Araneus ventricosus]|uniref:Uncharacterized protein n=1 Tax=Araneus ventricosus TaxID=182803 RepID=A0A4Y2CV63_ARAVE|nr:hypothetical protein AVEN_15414-1 [Araneus ventricosus]